MRLYRSRFGWALAAALTVSSAAFAQAPAEAPTGPPPGFHHGGPMEFGRFEMGFDRKTVMGAPYSAQINIQTSNTLGDGTHVSRSSTGAVYRDSQGRVRREMTLPALASLTGSNQSPRAVVVNDPVAGYSYVLRSETKVAVRRPLPAAGSGGRHGNRQATPGAGPEGPEGDLAFGPGGAKGSRLGVQVSKVSLGTQMIEGVQAEGTRITRTIPAGAIGNDRAIQIVVERWYSNDLQTVVLLKRSDPWMGQSTFQLTNITRTEPAGSLFTVPSDYTVQDRPAPPAFGPRGGGPPPKEF
jgi:hypothetical protein